MYLNCDFLLMNYPITVLQVSIEYGLCEALCVEAIKTEYAPKDGIWFPDLSDLEAKLPIGTIDHSVDMVYKEVYCAWPFVLCVDSAYNHAIALTMMKMGD